MKIAKSAPGKGQYPYVVVMSTGTPIKGFERREEAFDYLEHIRKFPAGGK